MSPEYDAVAAWIRAGVQLLVDRYGAEFGPVHLRVWLEFSGHAIEVTLPSVADARRPTTRFATVEERPAPPVDEDDLAVLRLLAGEAEPRPAKQIASRLRVPNNGTLRNRLARLRRSGLLDHVSGRGYVLTDLGRRASGTRPGEGPAQGR